MDVMDKVDDIDGKHVPFLDAVLNELQQVKYKEDALNKNSPVVDTEATEPLAEDNIVFII